MNKDRAAMKGVWRLIHKSADGKVITDESVDNLITNEGFNYILDSSLNAVADVGTWYFAPYGTVFAASLDSTYVAPGGTEDTNYIEAERQAWGVGASVGQSVTNAAAAVITADTGGMAILGIGVVGAAVAGTSATKGDTGTAGGILLAEVASEKTLAVGETLSITYTISKS